MSSSTTVVSVKKKNYNNNNNNGCVYIGLHVNEGRSLHILFNSQSFGSLFPFLKLQIEKETLLEISSTEGLNQISPESS